jgi:iron complex outermembrane receptor protein
MANTQKLAAHRPANSARNWLRLAATTSALGLICGATPALAQNEAAATATEDTGGIQDIIVTAQRRSESAQKTALSIVAFSGDDLRSAGIAKPDDLTKLAPGLQVGGGTTTQVYIRGVGDFGVTATANPAVATSIDGVGIARPQAISGNFYDIERIEVLKGPQGTLYGRNASGGALNILTAQPKFGEFSGYAEGNVGNYNQYGIEGAFNVPAGDNSAFRLSYQLNRRDGYLTDGGDDDNHEALRFQGKFTAGDRLTIRTIMAYTHLGGNGTGLALMPALAGLSAWTGNTSPAAGAAYLARAGAIFNGALAGGCNPAPTGNCPPPPALLADPSTSTLFQNVKSYTASMQLDYDMDWATLTMIPAYRRTEGAFAVQPSFLYSVGGVYDAQGDRTNGETSDQYSLEMRLSHSSDNLKWVIGAYGFKEDQSNDFSLYGGLIQNQRVSGQLGTKAAAVFGQLTYSLADTIRLTGGLRYTSDKRDAFNLNKQGISPTVTAPAAITGLPPIPCLPNVPVAGARLPGTLCPLINQTPGYYDSSVTFNKVTWKAGVEVDLGPQSMLFADVSTGFKAGGFNQAVSLTQPTKLQPYAPETITAYTLGIKNRFMDNKIQLNIEGFYWDYKDLQLSSQAFDGAGLIVLLTQNAGKARVAGGDVNLVVRPWTGGTLRGAIEYVDSEYKQFVIQQSAMFVPPGRVGCGVSAPNAQGLVTVDCSGKPLIRSPKWSGNAGFNQVIDMANGGNFTIDADVSFAGSRYVSADFTAAQLAKSYANISASLTYNAPDSRWFVSAFVRNLTNAVIYTGGGGHQAAFVSGWNTSNIAPPRTWGGRFGVKF